MKTQPLFSENDYVKVNGKLIDRITYIRNNTDDKQPDYTIHLDKEIVYKLMDIPYWVSESDLELWIPNPNELVVHFLEENCEFTTIKVKYFSSHLDSVVSIQNIVYHLKDIHPAKFIFKHLKD